MTRLLTSGPRRSSQPDTDAIEGTAHSVQRLVVILFLAIYCLVQLALRELPGPESLVFVLLLLIAAFGRFPSFVRPWVPFLLILFGWQTLRGYTLEVIRGSAIPLHVTPMIALDRTLFGGHLPTLLLQRALYAPHQTHWYDAAATLLYECHFALPVLFALGLRFRDVSAQWRFLGTLVLLFFAGYATYLLYPAAPPWLASEWHYIQPHVYLIRDAVLGHVRVGGVQDFPSLVNSANPDLTASMPSLHAAYPTLVLWFCLRYWKRLVPLAIVYCASLWFTIVYIGDHYVIDVLVGATYATLSFLVFQWIASRVTSSEPEPLREERAVGGRE